MWILLLKNILNSQVRYWVALLFFVLLTLILSKNNALAKPEPLACKKARQVVGRFLDLERLGQTSPWSGEFSWQALCYMKDRDMGEDEYNVSRYTHITGCQAKSGQLIVNLETDDTGTVQKAGSDGIYKTFEKRATSQKIKRSFHLFKEAGNWKIDFWDTHAYVGVRAAIQDFEAERKKCIGLSDQTQCLQTNSQSLKMLLLLL